jgi:hypothetical protein
MKKLGLILVTTILLSGCYKEDLILPEPQKLSSELEIVNSVGIKLQSAFVT